MRRSGVRIPLAPPQADIRSGCRFFVCSGALVWCLLLCCSWRRWCSGRRVAYLDGPGRCVCRWAAARPRDRHTRACGSEWSISRPALALPPPTGALRRPPHQWRSRNSRLSLLLAAPLVFQVPSGPAAREARASLRSAPRLEARPCPPGPPAPYTPAAPGR